MAHADPWHHVIERFCGGRFEVVRRLGAGGFGAVYHVRHENADMGLEYAVKVIPRRAGAATPLDLDTDQRYQDALAASRLNHPGIVRIDDVGRDGVTGAVLVRMEYLSGETLDRVVEDTFVANDHAYLTQVTAVLARVADALAALHRAGVVHRDVKSANIMLVAAPDRAAACPAAGLAGLVPKIIDFGLAEVRRTPDAGFSPDCTALTHGWCAPEHYSGLGAVDERSDIFCFGIVAYHALTGHAPFVAHCHVDPLVRDAVCHQVRDWGELAACAEGLPPPSALNPALAAWPNLERFVLACLAEDRAQRPPSLAAFAALTTPQAVARPDAGGAFVLSEDDLGHDGADTTLAGTRVTFCGLPVGVRRPLGALVGCEALWRSYEVAWERQNLVFQRRLEAAPAEGPGQIRRLGAPGGTYRLALDPRRTPRPVTLEFGQEPRGTPLRLVVTFAHDHGDGRVLADAGRLRLALPKAARATTAFVMNPDRPERLFVLSAR